MKLRNAVGAAVAAALGAAGWYALQPGQPQQDPAVPVVSTTTAPVTVGDVAQRVQVAGTLAYDGEYAVINHLPPGILSRTAALGTTVQRGQNLFTVSGTPVVLLYGPTAAYRAFAPGMSDGPDVRQLETNLVALGMDPDRQITVDNHFSQATSRAIRRWQTARKLPPGDRIGALRLGEVVFLPGAVRVHETTTSLGAQVGQGAQVLAATSTTQVVTARLTTDRQHLVKKGDQVRVILPTGGQPVPATVTAVGRVAQPPAGGAGGQATVPVTVSLQLPDGAGELDQAPVQVSITTAVRTGVTMVPVTALLAKTGGGYQVRIVEATGTRLIDVQPGLYDDTAGTVEITADGLHPGMNVEVPQA